MRQQTLVIIKPDALYKSIVGDVLTPLSRLNLRIVGAKVVNVNEKLAMKHYYHLRKKKFFKQLISYFCGKMFSKKYRRVLALVYDGEDAIRKIRDAIGPTNPMIAPKSTIRGRFGKFDPIRDIMLNVVHCSSSEEEAEKEIKLWFKPEELTDRIYPTKKIKLRNVVTLEWK